MALKNHKNELTNMDNISKIQVLEGRKDIDMSKVVDITAQDDIYDEIEQEGDI
jgi:hypothetical protein